MKTVKTRKQGNAVMLSIPKSFGVKEGVTTIPRLTNNGIFFEFVDEDEFFDFDADILKNLLEQNYAGKELYNRFSEIKKAIPQAFNKLAKEGAKEPAMTKEELEKEIGL
ncbi:toxin-antitoxin system [Lactobacillus sp. ESL0679]|uniref:toxin-antitoxin system n=1 Tax=Lactobacillus sp. ESL0679 TaxID=2983209 RepID=UPI0023F99D78|nr:toxin-antitoxin system [Lactobacillus sp. ESL0679]MDF7683796.1 toxin-antitoxin system [Lactobacillus sp. ESL0679]